MTQGEWLLVGCFVFLVGYVWGWGDRALKDEHDAVDHWGEHGPVYRSDLERDRRRDH